MFHSRNNFLQNIQDNHHTIIVHLNNILHYKIVQGPFQLKDF